MSVFLSLLLASVAPPGGCDLGLHNPQTAGLVAEMSGVQKSFTPPDCPTQQRIAAAFDAAQPQWKTTPLVIWEADGAWQVEPYVPLETHVVANPDGSETISIAVHHSGIYTLDKTTLKVTKTLLGQ